MELRIFSTEFSKDTQIHNLMKIGPVGRELFYPHCSVTRLDENWLATTWVKVLGICFQMTTETDFLEAAATLVFTVEFSWSTVEMIAQASDDIIKVVPRMKTRSSDLWPCAY